MMKFIFGMQINIEVFYKLIQSFFVCATRHTQSTQNKFAYHCNISRKVWGGGVAKLNFCMQIRMKVFYKLVVSLWVCLARHAQGTQNNKFTISCNISRKTSRMKLIFCQKINIKDFSKFSLLLSFQVYVARHT